MLRRIELSFIEALLVFFYFLFAVFLMLGLLGFFDRIIIFISIILGLSIFVSGLFRVKVNPQLLIVFIITPLILLGFALLRGFFVGDVYEYWLPVAREIAVNGQIPDFFRGIYFSRMPFFPLMTAATFSVSGFFSQFSIIWIPLFFTSTTLYLLLQWTKETALPRKYLWYVIALFLSSVLVAFNGWNPLQEAPLLFFGTSFFYFLDRFLKNQSKRDLFFLVLAFMLVSASKFSGVFLAILLCYAFIRTPSKKVMFYYALILGIPLVFWLLRNYLAFGDPVYPVLSGFFPGEYSDLYHRYQSFRPIAEGLTGVWEKYWYALPQIILALPVMFLAFFELLKTKKWYMLAFIAVYFLYKETWLFTPTISLVRYYYIFVGVFIYYGVLGLFRINSRALLTGFATFYMGLLLVAPITDSTSGFISGFENKFTVFHDMFVIVKSYWYLFLAFFAALAYRASRHSAFKDYILILLSLFIVFLSYVVNKSWLNVWFFTIGSVVFLIYLAVKEKISKNFLWASGVFISVVLVINSWGLGLVYNLRQGDFQFPVAFLHNISRDAGQVIVQANIEDSERFSILVTSQSEYYNWFTPYEAVNFIDYGFFNIVREYDNDISPQRLKNVLEEKKFKYIIINSEFYEFSPRATENLQIFIQKVETSGLFTLLSVGQEDFSVWQVY